MGNKAFWKRLVRHRLGQGGLIVLAIMLLLAAAAPLLAAYSPIDAVLAAVRQPPNGMHLFGTDELGRDIFSRLLYGARVSLAVGIASVALATTLGLLYGVVSGYTGGLADNALMRLLDGLLSVPTLVLVIALQALSGQGFQSVIGVIAATSWMQTARIVRTEFLAVKQQPFVQAALTCGASDGTLIWRHILPNCLPSVVVLATMSVGHAIVTEAALSFLGMGIPPHLPSWGNMLMGGQRSILAGAWWITFFPGCFIVLTVLAINFLGDAVRDALDPLGGKGNFGAKGEAS